MATNSHILFQFPN